VADIRQLPSRRARIILPTVISGDFKLLASASADGTILLRDLGRLAP
jgi:hypothetical protein